MSFSSELPIKAYIDGSCLGNPGPGGWGVYLVQDQFSEELFGGEKLTTNNRMEMMAAIKALLHVDQKYSIELITDSVYLKNGITVWIKNWKKNGWRTSQKEPVKNQDLWIQIDELAKNRNLIWNWVKGHDGNFGNEKADFLAKKGSTFQ